MSNDVTALFNGESLVQLVQGEDVAIAIVLTSATTKQPFDLTGSDFSIAFRSVDDRTIVRSTLPLTVAAGVVAVGDNDVVLPNHGLVTGDVVTLTGAGLPLPLLQSQNYMVNVIDNDTFAFVGACGQPILFSQAASSAWQISVPGVTIAPFQTLGLVSVTLNANFTSQMQAGVGQTFQIGTIKNGMTHLYLENHELDVFEQV